MLPITSRLFGWMMSAAGGVIAQQTVVVDALGRPGSQFLDLPSAVAASVDGDTILVRPVMGFTYAAATITSGLAVLGDVVGDVDRPQVAGLTVRDVPVGRRALVNRLIVGRLEIARTPALVAVELTVTTSIRIADAAHVALHNVTASGSTTTPALEVLRAFVRMDAVDIAADPTHSSQPVAVATETTLLASQCRFAGIPGVLRPDCSWASPGAPGLTMNGGIAVLGHDTRVEGAGASNGACGTRCGGPGLAGNGFVVADATVVLPCGGTIVPYQVPMMSGTFAVPGTRMPVRLDAPPGSVALLLASYAPPDHIPTPQGNLAIDPGIFSVLAVLPVGASGSLSVPMSIRLDLWPKTLFSAQALVLSTTGEMFLSLPLYAGLWR